MQLEAGLTDFDMDMDIGATLDLVYRWVDFHDPNKKQVKIASQDDIDRMF